MSGSRNLDAEYKSLLDKDGESAYEYICVCHAPWDDDDDEEEDSSDEEEEDDDEESGAECDGGATCLCQKPAAEHPEHKWVLTRAGFY